MHNSCCCADFEPDLLSQLVLIYLSIPISKDIIIIVIQDRTYII